MTAVETAIAEQANNAPDVTPELSVTGVVPGAVAAIWPHVLPMIETAREAMPDMVSEREWPEDIKQRAEEGRYQIFLIYEGADLAAIAVTSIEAYARVKCCTINYMAGRDLSEWIEVWAKEIKQWAVNAGCTQIEARGRWGWGKKLKPLGGEIAGAAYVMEL